MFLLKFGVCLIMNSVLSGGSELFHQNSRITFYPDIPSSYFGYSVVLSNSSLIVGAPKAVSRVKDSISPGQVFTCRLTQLLHQNITCYPLGMDDSDHDKSIRRMVNVRDFFRNDMWFGATIATVPEGKLFVCAPRWSDPYKTKHLLSMGTCYVETKKLGITLTPLNDRYKLAFLTDGGRKEYGEYGTHLNFYAYGQAGMSIKVTENNSIILGAPGLMQWTGGIIDYKFNPDPNSVTFTERPIVNLYFTRELGPDDYFGYSVESGIFELHGSTLYVAGAPRSKHGYGQVLVFKPPIRDSDPLNIRAKVRGPQLGSYFGATLCCTDLNADGRADLLVGAPNYVTKEDDVPYDQGAVFVYLADVSSGEEPTFILKDAGHVSGIGESGARFGTAIAALGDVDGDGYNDVAIGAPWENEGIGAVYIYKGSEQGLKGQYLQRIVGVDAKGFGFSISKGLDIDANNCNDLAVGAHSSGTAYLFRCIPTITAHSIISVPGALSLPHNVSSFMVNFCVRVLPKNSWAHVKIDLTVHLTIDPEFNRASIALDEYKLTATPDLMQCKELSVEVQPTANLTKPILIKMDLEASPPLIDDSLTFHKDAARLSEDSSLHTEFQIQLMRDCGDDLFCTPLLVLTMEAIDSVYVPGSTDRLGVKITVLNKEEPAFSVKVYIHLPLPPKRIPKICSLEGLLMTCDVRSPLNRGDSEEWEIEVDYTLRSVSEEVLTFEAELKHPLYIRNENEKAVKDVNVTVVPKAYFLISGKAMPNNTMTITREKFYEAESISFVHYFEVTNLGPSDWISLETVLYLPENTTLSSLNQGCKLAMGIVTCDLSVPATASVLVAFPLKYELSKYGQFLEELTTFNATTTICLLTENKERLSIATKLVLEPAKPIWPFIFVIAVSTIIGLLLLAGIVYGLHRYGFFSRASREKLRRVREEQEEGSRQESCDPGCSTSPVSEADESTQELLSDDSD